MDRLKPIISALMILLLSLGCTTGVIRGAVAEQEVQEFSVIGQAVSGPEQFQVYREALEDGLRKAFALARQTGQNSSLLDVGDREKDLVTLQRELGVVDFRVLRYWTEQDRFRMELKVWLGDSKTQPPRVGSLKRHPRVNWSIETIDRIEAVSKYGLSIVINTLQSLEIVNPEDGKLARRIKTGFKPHLAYGNRYLVNDLDKIKVYSLDLFNLNRLINIWNKELPGLNKYYLIDHQLIIVEQTGLVRAFNWEDGEELWQLPAITQVEIGSGSNDQTLLIYPSGEFWAVNKLGQKVWVKKEETPLAAIPIVDRDDLVCLFNDGQLKIYDSETGRNIASWKTGINGLGQVKLSLSGNEIYILYNDLGKRGHLQVYHRGTGRLLWKVDWDEPVIPNLIQMSDTVIVGLSGTFEAREKMFGLKVWEERTIGRITGLFYNEPKLMVIMGNRIYGYQL